MKVYAILPTFDLMEEDGGRSRKCISAVAELITDCLRANGDCFHFAVDWRDPDSTSNVATWHEDKAKPNIVKLPMAQELLDRVTRSVDPFDNFGATIRSIATCRAVTFGFDGQAFICLRHEDHPPISPDEELLTVEERPDILLNTDYFDGWLRNL